MRTITVKGIDAVSVKPDLIVLRLSMETAEYEYDAAMKAAAEKIEPESALRDYILEIRAEAGKEGK